MALTTCKDCGREVSKSAAACPGCGRPMAGALTVKPQRAGIGCGTLVALTALVAILRSACPDSTPTPPATPPVPPPQALAPQPPAPPRDPLVTTPATKADRDAVAAFWSGAAKAPLRTLDVGTGRCVGGQVLTGGFALFYVSGAVVPLNTRASELARIGLPRTERLTEFRTLCRMAEWPR